MTQGKKNNSAANPTIDIIKNPHYLVLISDNFMKACAALSPSEISDLQSNQIRIKTEATSVSQRLCNALLFTMSYFITFSSCFYDNIKLLMFPLTFLHFVVN